VRAAETGAPHRPDGELDGGTPDAMGVAGVSPSTQTATRLRGACRRGCRDQVKLKLDLHEIYNRGDEIERTLRALIDEAVAKKAPLVEIITGKGSGQLKKRVLRFLDLPEIKACYHRVEKDRDNFGRVFVHFRWK
jgi:DNA-nicking Smr family endonuclease